MKDLALNNADRLFSLVKCESLDQIEKWGIQDRTPFEWMIYLTAEAIQTATLSLKIAEMYLKKTEGTP